MKYIRSIEDYTGTIPAVVTIGKFDGLHKGHQLLFRRLRELSEQGYVTICFTFDVQPKSMIQHKEIPLIMTPEELHAELEREKVDILLECHFTDEIRRMEPEEFVDSILLDKLHMKFLVVGSDFHFGYKGKGNCDYLIDHANERDYFMNVIPCKNFEDQKISSTLIRDLIMNGRLETANMLLGHDYRFNGEVVEGKHIGRRMGIPTLNIIPDRRKVLPPNGVYAAYCTFDDGRRVNGIVNIGVNPTIADGNRTMLEMNLFDFNDSIYQQHVEIALLKYIRPEQKFDSIDDLRSQVLSDIEEVKALFEEQ